MEITEIPPPPRCGCGLKALCLYCTPSEMWKMYTALTLTDLCNVIQIVDNDGNKNRPEIMYLLLREKKTHNLKHFWQEL